MSQTTSAPATETSEAALNTVNVEIAGLQVTLPVKFSAGHTLTDAQAKVLDAAYQRQFTNNQNAMAKARAEKLAKATTNEEKAAAAPLTAAQIAELYTNYEPQVGGGPRLGSMEKLRLDAAWRAYVKAVKDHNDAIKAGQPGIFAASGPVAQMTAPRKTKDVSEEAHKAALEEYQNGRTAFLQKMLALPKYAERIQIELDALMAERGKAEAEAEGAVDATADVL